MKNNIHITKINKNLDSEAGFVIFTIPVLLVLFGFFVSSIINDTKPNQFYFETATQEKLEKVKVALATYAHRNYRIPCPARADETADMLGTQAGFSGDQCSINKGILPFRELGLTEDYAKDEWGNYLTYKISPDFARQVAAVNFVEVGDGAEKLLTADATNAQSYVHQLCRTPEWINANQVSYTMSDGNSATMASQNINENIYKARFCCPSNVSGAGSKTFKAEHQDFLSGQPLSSPVNLSSNDGDAGDDELYMSFESVDSDIALIDESVNPDLSWDNDRYKSMSEYYAAAYEWAKGSLNFHYNPALDIGDKYPEGLGSGFGPQRYHAGELSSVHSGKFFGQAMELNIDTDKVKTNNFTMSMTDLGTNNWLDPVQISMDVVDSTGTVIDTISYVVQLPQGDGISPGSPQYGVGTLNISLDQIMGEADQAGLFHPAVDNRYLYNYDLPASHAVDLFNNSKSSLTAKLAAEGLTIDDVSISRLKMNATHASIAFGSITYGSPAVTTNTDLIIRDEAANERLTPRDSSGSYASSSTAVIQDFEAAAYALISHGPDGEGSYLANGTNNMRDNILDANENPAEVLNHTDLREVRDIRKVNSNIESESFDDIVMWDSQITLYNSLRNGTCEKSQAL